MKDRIIRMLDYRYDSQNAYLRLIVALTILFALVAALSVLGAMEKADNDNAVKEYCKGVHEGIHPDYNKSYQRQCLNGEPKQ